MSDLPDYESDPEENEEADDAQDAPQPAASAPNPYRPHSIFWTVQQNDLPALNVLFNGGFSSPAKLRGRCYYFSPILRSRMDDIVALGELRPTGPFTITDNLAKEYLRENTVIDRMPVIRNHEDSVEDRKRAKEGKLQMRPPVHGFCWSHDIMGRRLYGWTVQGHPMTWAHHFGASWWSPLHLAAFLGHTAIVATLLDKGYNFEEPCRGLCDCLTPSHYLDTPSGKADPVGGTLSDPRPDWNPLHYAICGGHLDTAKLLVSRGANKLVGRPFSVNNWKRPNAAAGPPATPPNPVQGGPFPTPPGGSLPPNWQRPTWPALHSAARTGNVPMVDYILSAFPHSIDDESSVWRNGVPNTPVRSKVPRPPPIVSTAYVRSTALIQAAAAGHIRTAGKYLLERGARFAIPGYTNQELRDPLRVLCAIGRYGDAVWLADFLVELQVGGRQEHVRKGPTKQMRRSIAACLGILRKRARGGLDGSPGDWAWASARERQDRWCPEIKSCRVGEDGEYNEIWEVNAGGLTEEDVRDHLKGFLPRLKELGG